MGHLILSTILVDMKDKEIGLQIKKARLESGLSQEEVATKIGVTWEMISRYENGRTSSLKHLRKLGEVLDKPINFFISSTKENNESFTIENIVNKLKESAVTYSSAIRNVVRIIEDLSGRGIEDDLRDSDKFVEAKISYTEKYPELFALKVSRMTILPQSDIREGDVVFLTDRIEPKAGQTVLSFDGVNYTLGKFDPNTIDVPLAVVVGLDRKYD